MNIVVQTPASLPLVGVFHVLIDMQVGHPRLTEIVSYKLEEEAFLCLYASSDLWVLYPDDFTSMG